MQLLLLVPIARRMRRLIESRSVLLAKGPAGAFCASGSIFIGRSSVVRKSPNTTQVPSGVWRRERRRRGAAGGVHIEEECSSGSAVQAGPTGAARPSGKRRRPGQRRRRESAANPAVGRCTGEVPRTPPAAGLAQHRAGFGEGDGRCRSVNIFDPSPGGRLAALPGRSGR